MQIFHHNFPQFLVFLKKRYLFKKSIIVFAGPPLTGKSTLGKKLAKSSNFTLLDVDEIRQKLFPGGKRLPEEEERDIMRACYRRNHQLAQELLLKNHPVILVATYSREYSRSVLKELSVNTDSPLRFFLFDAPEEEIKIRLEKRQQNHSLSNIKTYATFLAVKNRYKEITDIDVKNIDTSKPLSENLQQILESLKDLKI